MRDIQTLFSFGVVRDLTDSQLLGQFLAADRGEAERAFTLLVERHGPMVLHVCRQVLDDSHDAQDAFQATFLVFLRRAGSIRRRDSLASWLFGVALRVARRARHTAIIRRFHERRAGELTAARATATDGHSGWLAALHEEILRLPQRYREPIVLCHLEGLSTAAVAQRLGCAHGTILSRLARARERLRRRLTRRGQLDASGLYAEAQGSPEATLALPAALVDSTVRAAMHAVTGPMALTAIVTPSVVAMAQSILRTRLVSRILLIAALLMTTAAATAVAVPFIRPTPGAGSRAASSGAGPRGHREGPRPIEPKIIPSRDLEDAVYRILKRDHVFNHPRWPFVIKVRDVEGKTLIDASFKHRTKGEANAFDVVIQARRAVLRFDIEAKVVRAFLEGSEVQRFGLDDRILIDERVLEIPIPPGDLLDVEQGPPAAGGALPESRIVMMDSDQALSLVYSSDGKTLATAGFDGVVHLWDMMKAEKIADLKGESSTIRSVAFAPDGKIVACVNDAGLVRLWDVATGRLKQTWPGLSESMRQAARTFMLDGIAFAPDGRRLAVSGFGPTEADLDGRLYELRVFDVRAGHQPSWSHMGRGEQACALAFAPDGAMLARAGWRTVKLWDAKTGEPVRTLTPAKGTIFAIAFTPDGKSLVGGGNIPTEDVNHQAGLVTLWNVATGQIVRTLEGHRGGVHAVTVAPDGKRVASGGDGPSRGFRSPSEVRLWDIATGKLLWMVEGEQGVVRGLAFAPDGRTLVYCDDGAINFIDVATGRIDRALTKTKRTPRL